MGNVVFNPVVDNKEWGQRSPWSNLVREWYDTSGYYRFQFYFEMHGDPKGLPASKHHEMRRWMEKNLEGEIIIKISDRRDRCLEQSAFFELESDAAAFKLTWGQYILNK